MYVISNNSFKFKEILIQNNLFFSDNILNNLLNSKLKKESQKLYTSLISKQIYINRIKIADRYIYTCIYGNIKLLESNLKKQYIYYTKNISEYGKLKYEYFLNNKSIKENINVCVGNEKLNKRVRNIIILNIDNISELRSIDIKKFDKHNLYLFNFYDINYILTIADNLLIIEAKYEANVVKLVDYFLELGKEILVFPGDIWNKNCYFSNFLIKEGANVVLNINDINLYL